MEVFIGIALIILAVSIGKSITRSGWTPAQLGRPRVIVAAPKLTRQERLRALEIYHSLAKDKLDVMKTALAMGYRDEDIKRLDERLEKLVGREALAHILSGNAPKPHPELLSRDVEQEKQTLQSIRATQSA